MASTLSSVLDGSTARVLRGMRGAFGMVADVSPIQLTRPQLKNGSRLNGWQTKISRTKRRYRKQKPGGGVGAGMSCANQAIECLKRIPERGTR